MLRGSQSDGKVGGLLLIFLLSDNNLAADMDKGAFVGALRDPATGQEQSCPPRNTPGVVSVPAHKGRPANFCPTEDSKNIL